MEVLTDHSLEDLIETCLLTPITIISGTVFLFAFIFHLCSLLVKLLKLNSFKEVKPHLYYKESAFSRYLLSRIPLLSRPYRLHTLLSEHPTLHTVLARYILPVFQNCSTNAGDWFRFDREFLQLCDRGLLALDWAVLTPGGVSSLIMTSSARGSCGSTNKDQISAYHRLFSSSRRWTKSRKLVLILIPDLTEDYLSLSALCQEALLQDIKPVIFNRRGHSGCPLTTPRLQPYGDPGDLRQAIKYVRSKIDRDHKMAAIGIGTGGDLLLSYLGEYGSSAYLSAGVAISPLYNHEQISSTCAADSSMSPEEEFFKCKENGQSAMVVPEVRTDMRSCLSYCRLLGLKALLCRHYGALNRADVNVSSALSSGSVAEFDRWVYWRMCNCEMEEQYWEKNCPLRDVDDISTPILCINSLDDPLVTHSNIPFGLFRLYPHFFLYTTQHGGHAAFLRSRDPKIRGSKGRLSSYPQRWMANLTTPMTSWAEALALEFLAATLDFSAGERNWVFK